MPMPIPPRPRAVLAVLAVLILGAGAGCAGGRRQITPTTTGTDLRGMPAGRMTPLPFPGSSLARARPTAADPARPGLEPRADPAAIVAGGPPAAAAR